MAYNPNAVWTSKKKTYGAPSSPAPSSSGSGIPPSETPPKIPANDPQPQPEPDLRDRHEGSFISRHGLALFGIGLVVLIGAALGVAYLLRPPATPSVTIEFSKPGSSIPVGIPVVLGISATNNSATSLTGSVLTVTLPDGISFVGDAPNERAKDYAVGDIASGTVASQTSTIIVTGNPETLQRIKVKLAYTTPLTGQTQFENDAQTNFQIGDAAVSLSYNAPTSIISGQNFTFTVNYQNLTAQEIDAVALQANFPSAFTFATSSIPLGQGNTWTIGTLPAGGSGSFTVSGVITAPAQSQYPVSATVLAAYSGQNYPINQQSLSFAVVTPPLSITIVPNGSSSYVSAAGDNLTYTINYANNTSVNFASVKISATLTGAMFNLSSLQTSGAFDSRSNTITWFAANTPELTSVAPGQSGAVTFSIRTKNAFPIVSLSDKNYVLSVAGTIQSPTVPPNTAGTSTISSADTETKVGGEIAFTSSGFWKSGPYPPKVNQTTYYSVHWILTNYSTDLKNVTVSASLQSGSVFTGAMTSTIAAVPSYDAGTGLITWTIPDVAAGTGVAARTKPVEVDFEIANTPADNQVGQTVTLLGKTSLSSTDTFTGNTLSLTANAVTTLLPDDARVAKLLHNVVQ